MNSKQKKKNNLKQSFRNDKMSNSSLLIMKLLIKLLFACVAVSSPHQVQASTVKECNCHCSKVFKNEMSVCKNLYELKEQVYHVSGEVEKRTKHIGDLSDLMERVGLHEVEFKKLQKIVEDLKIPSETIPTTETRIETTERNILEDVEKEKEHTKEITELKERLDLQEAMYKNLLKVVEDLKKSKDGTLPKPQSLVSSIDDDMLGDSSLDTRKADGSELAKNMSDLLAKVEVVENLTSKVQEELKSERRVRRHLEEDLNETRTSIKLLNDKLENVSLPMENRNELIEEITLSTLESINKTLFEEQLQKLYYHLDGVAYKNETKYLYEHMDKVKDTFLNASSGNVLVFEEELRSLSATVSSLNENFTVELTLKEIRLNALEAKTNEIDDLDEQLNLLMNASELIHGGIEEMWKDVQEIQNGTLNMNKGMNEQIREIDNFTESAIKQMSEKFENITLEMFEKFENITLNMSDVNKEMVGGKISISAINHELALMARDLTTVENRMDLLGITDNKLMDIELKVQYMAELWNSSVVAITEHILRENRIEKLIMHPTCTLPEDKDDHLLMSLKNDSSGQPTLEFGCRPIGKFILSSNPTVLNCNDGVWNGPIPACIGLLDEQEVDNVETELRYEDPCKYSFGNVSDPVDCTYYFQCAVGPVRRMRMNCSPGHHFNPMSKRCEPAYTALCQTDRDKLTDLVPPILIDPDNVDKPYGLMGTGLRGELIVHPRTTFTLHCLFPSSAWGPPHWRFLPGYSTGGGEPGVGLETRHESLQYMRTGQNRYAVSITGASSRDSGVYMCVSPRGKFNMIEVIVKSVHCPPIPSIDEEPSNAFYRAHPEGESRILSTAVEFQCRGGFSITATCRADGTWSRPAPTREECFQEDSLWGCPPINTSDHPNLILERDEETSIITFRCINSRLIGNAFSRCINGEWAHAIPRCAPIFP